tara:strand:- start:164 stop:379 length:216 start_codon:yes stop_codon:yes gene_type:complete
MNQRYLGAWREWLSQQMCIDETLVVRMCEMADYKSVDHAITLKILASLTMLAFLTMVLWWMCAIVFLSPGP